MVDVFILFVIDPLNRVYVLVLVLVLGEGRWGHAATRAAMRVIIL